MSRCPSPKLCEIKFAVRSLFQSWSKQWTTQACLWKYLWIIFTKYTHLAFLSILFLMFLGVLCADLFILKPNGGKIHNFDIRGSNHKICDSFYSFMFQWIGSCQNQKYDWPWRNPRVKFISKLVHIYIEVERKDHCCPVPTVHCQLQMWLTTYFSVVLNIINFLSYLDRDLLPSVVEWCRLNLTTTENVAHLEHVYIRMKLTI